MTNEELCTLAVKAMKNAYTPYSDYRVGAALLTKSGKVYTGCNIENASYSPTVCAERTAIFKAVSEGEREFLKIAVAGGKNGKITGEFPPCGVCRQVMAEFCGEDFEILVVKGENSFTKYKFSEILPFSFNPKHIKKV